MKKKGRKSSEAEVIIQKSLSIVSLPQLSFCMKNGKVVYENTPSNERQQHQSLKKSEKAALRWFEICLKSVLFIFPPQIYVEISSAELEYQLEKYKLETSWAEQGHTRDFLFIRISYEFPLWIMNYKF